MVEGVFAPPYIEGIAVGEEGPAAQFLDRIRHRLGKVRAQKGKVSRLAKVDFDGGVLVFKVDVANPRLFDKLLQLLQQILSGFSPHIGKINF